MNDNIFKFIDKYKDILILKSVVLKMNNHFKIEKKISTNKFSFTVFVYCDLMLCIKNTLRICIALIIDAIILLSAQIIVNLESVKNIIEYIKLRILGLIRFEGKHIKDTIEIIKKLKIFIDVHKSILVDKYFLEEMFSFNYPSLELKVYLYKVGGKNVNKMIYNMKTIFESLDMDTRQIQSLEINNNIFEYLN